MSPVNPGLISGFPGPMPAEDRYLTCFTAPASHHNNGQILPDLSALPPTPNIRDLDAAKIRYFEITNIFVVY